LINFKLFKTEILSHFMLRLSIIKIHIIPKLFRVSTLISNAKLGNTCLVTISMMQTTRSDVNELPNLSKSNTFS